MKKLINYRTLFNLLKISLLTWFIWARKMKSKSLELKANM
jgi:hypothetical protein